MKAMVKEIRLGLIKASIYRNETRQGERHNVSLCRLFKNGDTWQQSQVLNKDDLLLAAKVLDLAHTWILESLQSKPQIEEIAHECD